MPQVSVIIPVFNASKHLARCLGSVCNQTLPDLEIICVNDGSTDDSLLILKAYAQKDKRIKLIDLKKNRGAAVARNLGIKASTGRFIGFVDADDFIDLNFYEKLYNRAVADKADVAKGTLRVYENAIGTSTLAQWANLNPYIRRHKAYFLFTFTTAIFKSSLIKNNGVHFLEGLTYFEDPFFAIMASIFIKKISIVENTSYYYSDNPDSVTRKQDEITIKFPQAVAKGAKLILKLLKKHKVEKRHYVIVCSYVMRQLTDWCERFNNPNEINIIAAKGLDYVLGHCLYRKECLIEYFLFKKNMQHFQSARPAKDVLNRLRGS